MRPINKKHGKSAVISAVLAALMLVSTVTVPAFADEKDTDVSKDETVYVIAGADGSVDKVIVSDWLKNSGNESTVRDYTELQNVENTKSDTDYSMDSDNMHIWNTDGSDVYYKGSSDKALPVEVKLSYQLDGKTVSAEEIAGKSGHVTIRFDYENKQKETVKLDGKDTEMYVPFLMISGAMFDNEHFSNIEVSNGKAINDGEKSIVVGMAMPGLTEDLDIDNEDIDIPDHVEISADTDNFSLDTTMTFATSDLLSSLDLDNVDDMDSLKDSMDQLLDASEQLSDGSGELKDGLDTLLDKSGELINGVSQLDTGAGTLDDGIKTLLSSCGTLSDGISKLAGGSSQLSGGLAELNAQTGTLSQGVNLLAAGSGDLSTGLSKLNGNTDALITGVSQLKAGLYQLVKGPEGNNGMDYAASGAQALNSGIAEAYSGAQQLHAVSQSLAAGIGNAEDKKTGNRETAVGGVAALNSGASSLAGSASELNKALTDGDLKGNAAKLETALGAIGSFAGDTGAGTTVKSDSETIATKAEDISSSVSSNTEHVTAITGAADDITAIRGNVTAASTDIKNASSDMDTASAKLGDTSTDISNAQETLGKIDTTGMTPAQIEQINAVSGYLSSASSNNTSASSSLNLAKSDLGSADESLGTVDTSLAGDVSSIKTETAAIVSDVSADTKVITDTAAELKTYGDKYTAVVNYSSAESQKGYIQLAAGVAGLSAAAQDGISGLSAGAADLSSGLTKLNGKTDLLIAGAAGLESGLSDLCGDAAKGTGLSYASAAMSELSDGIRTADEGANILLKGASALGTSVGTSNDKKTMNQSTLVGAIAALDTGASQLDSGIGTLSRNSGALISGVSQLNNGAYTLNAGLGELNGKTGTLVGGVSQLSDGSAQLRTGLDTLNGSTGTLLDGVTQLDDGAVTLNDGMKEFKEEGIDKLVEVFGGDIEGLISRLKAIADVAGDYSSYSGKAEDMDGNVKFIYKTAEISA